MSRRWGTPALVDSLFALRVKQLARQSQEERQIGEQPWIARKERDALPHNREISGPAGCRGGVSGGARAALAHDRAT